MPVLREPRSPDGGVSLPPIGALALSTFDFQQSSVLPCRRVRISVIPLQIAMLCFHDRMHSFALREKLTLLFLVTPALVTQIAGGGVYGISRIVSARLRRLGRLPLLTTHYPRLTPPSTLFPAPPLASSNRGVITND